MFNSAKSLVKQSLLFILIVFPFSAKSQTTKTVNIVLSHYTVTPQETDIVIGKIGLNSGTAYTLKLTGKNSRMFALNGDQLILRAAGSAQIKQSGRLTLTVRAKTQNGSSVKKTFAIVRNDFVQNKVIAHRGAWKNTQAPQNSLASLKAALTLGVTGSEFDIHLTADDVLVINHDATFEGLTIEKSTYADLLKHPLKNGEPIPTLENFLKTGMGQQRTKLVAELKPSILGKERSLKLAGKVVELVQQLQAQAWMVYISFDYDILKKILELDPFAKTQYLDGTPQAEQLKTDGMMGADYHYSVYQQNEHWIEEAHEQGIVVNVWTVNDAQLMNDFLSKNIDFITTDEPEMLLTLVTKRMP